METYFFSTTGKCLDFFYYAVGDSPATIHVYARRENLDMELLIQKRVKPFPRVTIPLVWKRLHVRLPDGIHQVVIQGTRSRSGSSGIAIDDVSIDSCKAYGEDHILPHVGKVL